MTYGLAYESRKTDHYISGVPFVGMIFLLIGGLISTFKPLALICLIYPGPWMLIYSVALDYNNNRKNFGYIEENGFTSIPFNEDRLETEAKDPKGINVALTFEVKPA